MKKNKNYELYIYINDIEDTKLLNNINIQINGKINKRNFRRNFKKRKIIIYYLIEIKLIKLLII